jgi:hypothetical protein
MLSTLKVDNVEKLSDSSMLTCDCCARSVRMKREIRIDVVL